MGERLNSGKTKRGKSDKVVVSFPVSALYRDSSTVEWKKGGGKWTVQ